MGPPAAVRRVADASWWARHPGARTVAFALVYMAAAWLGRQTRLDGSGLALVWPAAAVGAGWLLASWGTRRVAVDAVLLALATVAVNHATGAPLPVAVGFATANVALAGVTVAVQQALRPEAWRLRHVTDLGVLVVACVTGALVSAVLGPLVLWASEGGDAVALAASWVLRNAANTLVFGALALRLADHGLADLRVGRGRGPELAAALGLVAAVHGGVFGTEAHLPLTFLVLPVSLWFALRFPTTVAAAHVLLAGVLVVALTALERGPFAVGGPTLRVLLAQAFVAVVTVVTLVLALSRDSRRELTTELESARRAAQEQAALLAAVLDTVPVGIVACDPAGRLTVFNRATRAFHGTPEDPEVPPEAWAERYGLLAEDGETPLTPSEVPLARALTEGSVRGAVIVIDGGEAPPRTLVCDGRRLQAPDGTHLGAVVAMNDVTALRDTERRFRTLFEQAPTPLARLDAAGRVLEANRSLGALVQRPDGALVGLPLDGVIHPEDR